MNHVMLDLETLGTKANSVIVSIGAVQFDLETGQTGKTFKRNIDIQSCIYFDMEINASTLKWWFERSSEAQKALFDDPVHIMTALMEFREFLRGINDDKDQIYIWGNSARFDVGILANAYDHSDTPYPWGHRNERDVRTLVSFAPEIKENHVRTGLDHEPLSDCINQIQYCSKIYNKILSAAN